MKNFFLAAVVILFFWIFWPGAGKGWVEITVSEGQSAHNVAQMLKDSGLIRSTVPFRFWMRARRAGSRIHVGRYRFPTGRSSFWIVDDLIQGRIEKVRLVIPE